MKSLEEIIESRNTGEGEFGKIISETTCELCKKPVDIVGYGFVSNPDKPGYRKIVELIGYRQFCKFCGYGRVQVTPEVLVTGMSNKSKYAANRLFRIAAIERLSHSSDWIGTEIEGVVDAWNEADKRMTPTKK